MDRVLFQAKTKWTQVIWLVLRPSVAQLDAIGSHFAVVTVVRELLYETRKMRKGQIARTTSPKSISLYQ